MNKTQEKIKKERQKLTNQIIENLEKEGSIWKKGWNSELLTPYNPTNGTNYKG
ncbi:ArdC-like ssDNA-binding domain-containing protein, partial [Ilyobacter sp.]|uniref:ArdC-like ssDNA-binding domain-containing protein n=1 Tax=Ilyobacter sp. TaxID=3100343 RepID=UPI00356469C1